MRFYNAAHVDEYKFTSDKQIDFKKTINPKFKNYKKETRESKDPTVYDSQDKYRVKVLGEKYFDNMDFETTVEFIERNMKQ